MARKVLYTAAHSGFNLGRVPLGGGGAICERLSSEWSRTKPFAMEILGPSMLEKTAPQEKDLVGYSELEYARFCHRFEQRLTDKILEYDPKEVIILCNDVSEGPDFQTVAAKGYSIYTIYHVDVVDYFTAIYLRSRVKPETTTAFYRGIKRIGLSGAVPKMLRLIWEKQEASVRYSKGLMVPSHHMKEVLLRCYPELNASRVHVLPWGGWEDPVFPEDSQRESEALIKEHPALPGAWRLLTLSRISPEKGQERLLKALALWEKQSDYPSEGIHLFIAGESAYMMGKKYELTLQKISATLKKTKIHFVGYTAGAKKKALFESADIYVFPSKHESYGLTLMEALRSGLPVLVTPSHGAQEVFKPEFGEMVPAGPESQVPELLLASLKRLMSDRLKLRRMGEAGAAWSRGQDFSDTAARLADILIR